MGKYILSREEDGIIYSSVTSNGTTSDSWRKRLKFSECTEQVLRSPDFKPTNGVTTEIVILKSILFEDNCRITKNIQAEADKRKLSKPNAELACFIREKFTDKEIKAMGLKSIVVMHEPINTNGGPNFLGVNCVDDELWLSTYGSGPNNRWGRDFGFLFDKKPQKEPLERRDGLVLPERRNGLIMTVGGGSGLWKDLVM